MIGRAARAAPLPRAAPLAGAITLHRPRTLPARLAAQPWLRTSRLALRLLAEHAPAAVGGRAWECERRIRRVLDRVRVERERRVAPVALELDRRITLERLL